MHSHLARSEVFCFSLPFPMTGCIASSPCATAEAATARTERAHEPRRTETLRTQSAPCVQSTANWSRRSIHQLTVYREVSSPTGPIMNAADYVTIVDDRSACDGTFRIDAVFKAPILGVLVARSLTGPDPASLERELTTMRQEFFRAIGCTKNGTESRDRAEAGR